MFSLSLPEPRNSIVAKWLALLVAFRRIDKKIWGNWLIEGFSLAHFKSASSISVLGNSPAIAGAAHSGLVSHWTRALRVRDRDTIEIALS